MPRRGCQGPCVHFGSRLCPLLSFLPAATSCYYTAGTVCCYYLAQYNDYTVCLRPLLLILQSTHIHIHSTLLGDRPCRRLTRVCTNDGNCWLSSHGLGLGLFQTHTRCRCAHVFLLFFFFALPLLSLDKRMFSIRFLQSKNETLTMIRIMQL